MKAFILVAAMALALVFPLPSSAQSSDLQDRYSRWAAQSQIEIQESLRDPNSARWGRIVVSLYQGRTPMVCGHVNSRNAFGGYSGSQRYVWAGTVVSVLEEDMAPGEMDNLWVLMCSNVVYVARP